MKPPKLYFVFDRRKRASKTTKGSLEIEIYYNGRQYRISTGVTLLSTQWRNNTIIKCDDCASLNAHVMTMLNRLYEHVMEQMSEDIPTLSVPKLKAVAENNPISGNSRDFLSWLEERIDMRDIEESTRKHHKVMLRSLRNSGLFVTFQDLTPVNIKKWDDMLHKQLNCQTSVHGYHKRLKPYITDALQLGLIVRSPYENIRIKRSNGHTDSTKRFLKEPERDAIEALELSGGEEKARDMFIFACYTGLAYSDMVKITREDIIEEDGKLVIEDKRQKTGSGYRIVLLPKAEAILRKYDFNINQLSNQKCNQHLKLIAHRIGLKGNLTMHMGRHTFATWALQKGVRIEVVSKMLAHADITTTQIYAKLLQDEVDKGYDILSGALNPSEDTGLSSENKPANQGKRKGAPKNVKYNKRS